MNTYLRLTASLLAVGAMLGACSTANDQPYAHNSERHVTAAERMFGTVPDEPLTPAPGSIAATPVVVQPAPGTTEPLTVPQTVGRVSPSDATFAQATFVSSAVEIELARIAYVRAQSPDVRAFARQMLIDHRDMAIKLDNFALERGYLVDWDLAPDRAATINRLRTIDTASFDRAYMDEMVEAHQKAVQNLEIQAGSGRETAAVAAEALPTVQHHLMMAQQIQATL